MKSYKVLNNEGAVVKSFKNQQEALAFARRNQYDVQDVSKSVDRKGLREAKRSWG